MLINPSLTMVVVGVLFAFASAGGGAPIELVPMVGTRAIAGPRLIPQMGNAFDQAARSETSSAAMEAIAVVDPSGAGKTMLLEVILGLVEADAGQVVALTRDLGPWRRRHIGHVPQNTVLLDDTVAAN